MKVFLVHISPHHKAVSTECDRLTEEFCTRANRLGATSSLVLSTEAAFLIHIDRVTGRSAAKFILFDSRGSLATSEEFAATLGALRDTGTQQAFCCVGPADGWSPVALARAHAVISFGRLTIPHALARVLVAEQIYRALTILAGHPYHLGH